MRLRIVGEITGPGRYEHIGVVMVVDARNRRAEISKRKHSRSNGPNIFFSIIPSSFDPESIVLIKSNQIKSSHFMRR